MARLRLRGQWGAGAAWATLFLVMAGAFVAPALGLHDPLEQHLGNRLRPAFWQVGGEPRHPLGTDHLGRDILSRTLHGARLSLTVSVVAVVFAGSVGTGVGVVSAYYGGAADRLLMRLANIQLGMPFMLLAVLIIAIFGPSVRNLVIVLAVGGWVVYARVVRAQVLSLRGQSFVEAARALGSSDARIMAVHLVPNLVPSVAVLASFAVAQNIILESALSFLGLGAGPRTPSWGGMLADSRVYLATAWWLAAVPGVAIMLTVLSINTVGDWLRDAVDPRLRV